MASGGCVTTVEQWFKRDDAEAAIACERYELVVLDIELGRQRHAGVAIINAINKRHATPVPPGRQTGGAGLHPLLLPFAGLDFDDQQKVQQAMALSGCLTQYANNGALCVGIGSNPWAGGFIM